MRRTACRYLKDPRHTRSECVLPGLVQSERRGFNVYHRPRRDALTALCTVLNPNFRA